MWAHRRAEGTATCYESFIPSAQKQNLQHYYHSTVPGKAGCEIAGTARLPTAVLLRAPGLATVARAERAERLVVIGRDEAARPARPSARGMQRPQHVRLDHARVEYRTTPVGEYGVGVALS